MSIWQSPTHLPIEQIEIIVGWLWTTLYLCIYVINVHCKIQMIITLQWLFILISRPPLSIPPTHQAKADRKSWLNFVSLLDQHRRQGTSLMPIVCQSCFVYIRSTSKGRGCACRLKRLCYDKIMTVLSRHCEVYQRNTQLATC